MINKDSARLNLHDVVVLNLKFWILIMLATTIGEILGNFISRDLGLGYVTGSIILLSSFFTTVILVLIYKKQHHLFFWILIILGNVSGTDLADFVTRTLDLGNLIGSLIVSSVLTLLLLSLNFFKSKRVDVQSFSLRIEVLFWLAILTSGSLGTTFGDFLSSDTPLGSATGTLLMLMILGGLAFLALKTKFSKILAYWLAIVSVHVIGATFGNYISKPEGLNLGNIITGFVLILTFSLFLSLPQKDPLEEI